MAVKKLANECCTVYTLQGTFSQSAHSTKCATHLVNGDKQLISKREKKQF